MRSDARPVDVLLAGGGLAAGLIALRLSEQRPELRILIVEAGERLGGNHTWCRFETDLTDDQRAWTEPLTVRRWPGYAVRFPDYSRRLDTPYVCVTGERLHEVVAALPSVELRLGAPIADLDRTSVGLADQSRLSARVVIDARGPTATPDLDIAFQRFVGLEVELEQPHGLTEPVVMDAQVDQSDGYRFVYLLPFDDRRCLIEDTRYSGSEALQEDDLAEGVRAYAKAQGWTIARVLRRETGVLPVALGGDLEAHLRGQAEAPPVGLRAGLFHPTTGYSLPDAVRLADRIAALPELTPDSVGRAVADQAIQSWRGRGFYRFLNRMMMRASGPDGRYRMLQHFYRAPQPVIERFYASQLAASDKLRLLWGRPPIPIRAALGQIQERAA